MSKVNRRFGEAPVLVLLLALALVAVVVCGCPQKPAETTAPPMASQPTTAPEAKATTTAPSEEKSKAEVAEKGGGEAETVPAEYASLKNPSARDPKATAAGKALYGKRCAGCHGAGGKGDGPHAAGMDPKPANLTDADLQKELTDPAVFWRISEGVPSTKMPAYKSKLTEEERWCLVNCFRALAPAH